MHVILQVLNCEPNIRAQLNGWLFRNLAEPVVMSLQFVQVLELLPDMGAVDSVPRLDLHSMHVCM